MTQEHLHNVKAYCTLYKQWSMMLYERMEKSTRYYNISLNPNRHDILRFGVKTNQEKIAHIIGASSSLSVHTHYCQANHGKIYIYKCNSHNWPDKKRVHTFNLLLLVVWAGGAKLTPTWGE